MCICTCVAEAGGCRVSLDCFPFHLWCCGWLWGRGGRRGIKKETSAPSPAWVRLLLDFVALATSPRAHCTCGLATASPASHSLLQEWLHFPPRSFPFGAYLFVLKIKDSSKVMEHNLFCLLGQVSGLWVPTQPVLPFLLNHLEPGTRDGVVLAPPLRFPHPFPSLFLLLSWEKSTIHKLSKVSSWERKARLPSS